MEPTESRRGGARAGLGFEEPDQTTGACERCGCQPTRVDRRVPRSWNKLSSRRAGWCLMLGNCSAPGSGIGATNHRDASEQSSCCQHPADPCVGLLAVPY